MEKVYYRLPMVCSCGDYHNEELVEQAYDILSRNGKFPVTAENFLSRATYYVNDLMCTITLVADMWAGVDITCTEENPDEDEDAPEWITTYKFRVECDKVEEGLAKAIIHLHEMHMAFNPDGWYAKWRKDD